MTRLNLENTLLDGRYEILRCLAQGSYAEIFVARDQATNQSVIIKALNTALQGTPDPALEHTLVENFENEALVLDAVRHPNIVRRLGHGTALDLNGKSFYYLVLEFMEGGNLLEYCRQQGPLSLEKMLYYFQQVVEGLAHAHEARIIHRDLKPSNLLLSEDLKTIKIADFGVAKFDAQEGDEITRVGTNLYAPPEHHPEYDPSTSGGVRLTVAADIYSLAKTMYTVMSGQSPQAFSGRPITGLPPALSHLPYHQELLRIFKNSTATEVSERYADLESFWADFSQLGQWQEDEETRVRLRPIRSTPLELPEAAPVPHFLQGSGFRVQDVKPDVQNSVQPDSNSNSRIPSREPHQGRIVISLEPSPQPQAAPTYAQTQNLFTPSTPMVVPVSPPAPVMPPPSSPSEQPATADDAVQLSPTDELLKPNLWDRFVTPAVIGVLVICLVVLTFVLSMAGLYYTAKKKFSTASKPPGVVVEQLATPFLAVTKTGVKVRSTPTIADDNVLGTLAEDTQVEVLEVQGKWYRIRASNWIERRNPDIQEGWAKGTLFEREKR